MFWLKIKYKFGRIYKKFTSYTDRMYIDWNSVFTKVLLFMVILTLGYNVYNAYNKVMDSLQRYEDEIASLEALKEENDKLLKDYQYYQSQEFKKVYARDNLNLGELGEDIYMIKGEAVVLEIEKLPEEQVKITLEDNSFWWGKLLFGG